MCIILSLSRQIYIFSKYWHLFGQVRPCLLEIALHLHNIWISHCSTTSLTRGSTQRLDQEIPLGGLPKDECTRRPWTFPQLLVLGQLGRTDARQASAASRWKHHLRKWQCTESDGLTQKGTYFAIKGYLFCKKWSALGDPNTDSVEDD